MNGLIETLTGMNKMTDQVIATDFLISAKSAVQNYAVAITETTSPEIREVLKRQLKEAIFTHETISNYMMANGYYQAYDLQEQFKLDLETTDTALNLT
ncbi:spore coat protein [Clostridium beijerinckii]|nr:spore coat protein [Clostridium beijerinckii]